MAGGLPQAEPGRWAEVKSKNVTMWDRKERESWPGWEFIPGPPSSLGTDGACVGFPQEWWFDAEYGSVAERRAKEICQGCPVRVECLDYAIRAPMEYGIWGGETKIGRGKIKRGVKRR